MPRPLLLLLLAFCFTFPVASQARVVEGDWVSAGSPVSPYFPAYDYAYACKAELTDQQFHGSTRSEAYTLHAVAKFELRKGKLGVSAEELKWIWVAQSESDSETVLRFPPAEAFSTKGTYIGLRLQKGDPLDAVIFSAGVEVALGNYAVHEQEISVYNRQAEELRVRVFAMGTRVQTADPSLPPTVERRLLVRCRKIR